MPRCVKKFTFTSSFNFWKNSMKRYSFPILQRNKLSVVCSIALLSSIESRFAHSSQFLKIINGMSIYTTAIGKCYITMMWMNWDSSSVLLQHVLHMWMTVTRICLLMATRPLGQVEEREMMSIREERIQVAYKLNLEEQRGVHFKWKKM